MMKQTFTIALCAACALGTLGLSGCSCSANNGDTDASESAAATQGASSASDAASNAQDAGAASTGNAGTSATSAAGSASSSSASAVSNAQIAGSDDEFVIEEDDDADVPCDADGAVALATDDGVTSMGYAAFQAAVCEVDRGMTLADIQALMGAAGTALSEPAYPANSVAFYTANGEDSLVVVFDGPGSAALVVSCTTTVE